MLVLTGMSSLAHAADVGGGSIAGVELTLHSQGDGDEVPSDADNAFPHHHNVCHGHDVGEPIQSEAPCVPPLAMMRPIVAQVPSLIGTLGFVDLRPPQA
jgi:hypothetical protein